MAKKIKHDIAKLSQNGKIVNDPNKIVNIFNNYFSNLVDTLIVPKLNSIHTVVSNNVGTAKMSRNKYNLNPLCEKDMNSIINSFNNKYSTGYDDIPMPIIKLAKQYLIKPLTHLVNSSFVSGMFPTQLKISKIKPLFKSGDPMKKENYRPLSLISSFAKIYERAVANVLIEYLEKNELISNEQHGFRAGKSVISASIQFIESIIDAIDRGEKSVGVFMDLCKAFDSVCHAKLLEILQKLGVNNRALKWFKSYLADRFQFVDLNFLNRNNLQSYRSSKNYIKYGVPQGSVLGPLLFLCYINDLPNCSQLNNIDQMTLYADDINLKLSHHNMQGLERNAFSKLEFIQKCLVNLKLLLNFDKTKFIKFSANNRETKGKINISINNYELEEVTELKFLGLTVDQNLNWNSHVEVICNKISTGLFALRKLSGICNLNALRSVYFAFIHSHISFGISLYGSTGSHNLNHILILQKRAVRIMLKLQWNDSAKQHFANLGIMTVYSLYIYELILLIKRNFSTFLTMGFTHNYNTRNKNEILFTSHKLNYLMLGLNIITFCHKTSKTLKNITNLKSELEKY